MKKAVWSAVTAVAFLACAGTASAQLATQNINATVNINNLARLDVSGDVNFPDTDPDLFATMSAPAITVGARARISPSQDLIVTVQAAADYFDVGTSTIPVTGLTWTATGSAFSNGSMLAASPVTLAAWTGPANQSGTQTYTLPNLWSYAPGTHTVVLTYTLTTP
jgi:hypothetical protein